MECVEVARIFIQWRCGAEMLQSGLPCVRPEKALPLTLLSSWPDAFDGDSHPLTSNPCSLFSLPARERHLVDVGCTTAGPHPRRPRPDPHFFTRRIIYGARGRYFLVIGQEQRDRTLDRISFLGGWDGHGSDKYFAIDTRAAVRHVLLQQSVISSDSISKPIVISCFAPAPPCPCILH